MGVGAIARAWRRFRRNRRGATAVEFALIAPAFIWLTAGMAEITMIGFSQTALDSALSQTARRIRTGEVQTTNMGAVAFKAAICSEMQALMPADCENDLDVDVDSYDSFGDVRNPSPLGGNGAVDESQFGYDPGASSDIVLVRGFYRWHVITPLFQGFFANTVSGGGRTERLLTSTILIRNEPF